MEHAQCQEIHCLREAIEPSQFNDTRQLWFCREHSEQFRALELPLERIGELRIVNGPPER
jgi:hypothetical protein